MSEATPHRFPCVCSVCHEEFLGKQARQNTCYKDECRTTKYQETQRAYRRKRKKKAEATG